MPRFTSKKAKNLVDPSKAGEIECLCEQPTYHQRGETIMAQRVLPFQYQVQNHIAGLTALDGLTDYLDLAQAAGRIWGRTNHT